MARNFSRIAVTAMALALAAVDVRSVSAQSTSGEHSASANTPSTQLVFFGPHSNLAHKYLWQSVLEIWDQMHPATIKIIAASRDTDEHGWERVKRIVAANTTCGAGIDSGDAADAGYCERMRLAFLANVTYVSVKDDAGYRRLGEVLRAGESMPNYAGRMYYMAVAADIVPSILSKITSIGGIETIVEDPNQPFSRVIVEKPLGRDLPSSLSIIGALSSRFGPSSLYMIDHYIGKTGLQIAAGFRKRLLQKEEWTKVLQLMAYSEVFMMETETAEGRTSFYNEYGIVRDVVQNHMTQMIVPTVLLAGSEYDHKGREAILQHFRVPKDIMDNPVPKRQFDAPVMLLQYRGYKAHIAADRKTQPFHLNLTLIAQCRAAPYNFNNALRSECAEIFNSSPTPYELHGIDFAAPTGVVVPLSGPSSQLYLLTASKASGVKTAFVRQVYTPPSATHCGPLTITYHVQGDIVLPAGVNSTGLPFDLPHNKPCIIITAACGHVLAHPTRVLDPESWNFEWEILHSSHHGVWIAVPKIERWSSSLIKQWMKQDGFIDVDITAVVNKQKAASTETSRPVPMTKRIFNHRLRMIADAPAATGGAAYKSLIAAGFAGLQSRFVSVQEIHYQWETWQEFANIADKAMSQGNFTIHEVGSRNWLRNLGTSRVGQFDAPAASASDDDDEDKPVAGAEGDEANRDLTIIVNDAKTNLANQFASDVLTVLWAPAQERPVASVAFDGGFGLERLYTRISQLDVSSLGPWPGVQIWTARERNLQPGAKDCVLGYILNTVTQTSRVDPQSFHAPFNPNVTHANALAKRLLVNNRLDLAIIVFPIDGDVDAAAAGRPDTEEDEELLDLWGSDVLGDDESDLYVSLGEGVDEAREQYEIESRKKGFQVPKNPDYAEGKLPDPASLPPNVTMEMIYPHYKLPQPPLHYKGRVDIRLSRHALQSARQVFLVLPLSILHRYQDEDAGIIETDDSGVKISVDASGEQADGERPDFAAVIERYRQENGALFFPPALKADISRMVGGRTANVRVYIEDLA